MMGAWYVSVEKNGKFFVLIITQSQDDMDWNVILRHNHIFYCSNVDGGI